jgi:hypothetical protein
MLRTPLGDPPTRLSRSAWVKSVWRKSEIFKTAKRTAAASDAGTERDENDTPNRSGPSSSATIRRFRLDLEDEDESQNERLLSVDRANEIVGLAQAQLAVKGESTDEPRAAVRVIAGAVYAIGVYDDDLASLDLDASTLEIVQKRGQIGLLVELLKAAPAELRAEVHAATAPASVAQPPAQPTKTKQDKEQSKTEKKAVPQGTSKRGEASPPPSNGKKDGGSPIGKALLGAWRDRDDARNARAETPKEDEPAVDSADGPGKWVTQKKKKSPQKSKARASSKGSVESNKPAVQSSPVKAAVSKPRAGSTASTADGTDNRKLSDRELYELNKMGTISVLKLNTYTKKPAIRVMASGREMIVMPDTATTNYVEGHVVGPKGNEMRVTIQRGEKFLNGNGKICYCFTVRAGRRSFECFARVPVTLAVFHGVDGGAVGYRYRKYTERDQLELSSLHEPLFEETKKVKETGEAKSAKDRKTDGKSA